MPIGDAMATDVGGNVHGEPIARLRLRENLAFLELQRGAAADSRGRSDGEGL